MNCVVDNNSNSIHCITHKKNFSLKYVTYYEYIITMPLWMIPTIKHNKTSILFPFRHSLCKCAPQSKSEIMLKFMF